MMTYINTHTQIDENERIHVKAAVIKEITWKWYSRFLLSHLSSYMCKWFMLLLYCVLNKKKTRVDGAERKSQSIRKKAWETKLNKKNKSRMNERTKDYGNWFRNFDIGRVQYMFYHLCISTLCNTGWHSIPLFQMLKLNISFPLTSFPSLFLLVRFGSVCSNWVLDLDIILCIIDDYEISYNFFLFHSSFLIRIKIFYFCNWTKRKNCKQRGKVLGWWLIKHLISYRCCLRRTSKISRLMETGSSPLPFCISHAYNKLQIMITNWELSGEKEKARKRYCDRPLEPALTRALNRSHTVEHIERSNVQYGFLCAIQSLCNRTAH